jgi:outer membrane lipoprotein-sorting protein
MASAVLARIHSAEPAEVLEWTSPRRIPTRTLAGIGMSLAALAAVVATMLFVRTDRIAFAQVQSRLSTYRTATLQFQQSVCRQDANQTEISSIALQVSVNADDGRIRVESPDGSVRITNGSLGKRLTTDAKKGTATLAYVYDNSEEYNLLAVLQSMHLATNAQSIEPKTIDGEKCIGFRIDEPQSILRVWVSTKTLLPVLAERSTENVDGPPPSIEHEDKVKVVTTFRDIRFGVPLADTLFDLSPPANYLLTEIGKPPASLSDVFPSTPQLVPLQGIGPIQFGMTQMEIVQLLGRPDREDISKPNIPYDENTSQVDDKPRPSKNSRLIILTEFHALTYSNLALRLDFEVSEGLVGLSFDKRVQLANGVEFPGTLANGLGIGSSEREIIATYGEPSKGYSKSMLYYKDSGLMFVISDERAVSTLQLDHGGERRLRFEWREPDDEKRSNESK